MTAIAGRSAQLDEVLDEFAGLAGPPDAGTVRMWVERYPEHKREIIAFAADWVAMDAATADHVTSAEQVDRVVNRTMSRVQSLLDRASVSEPLTDLGGAIRAAGYETNSFPGLVGIDRSIFDSLSMRLAVPESIPGLLVRSIAEVLQRSIDSVRNFFRLPPLLAGAHKSKTKPVAKQVGFAMLVKESGLTEHEKERWLKEPPDPGLQK